jgi:hypothetical protein
MGSAEWGFQGQGEDEGGAAAGGVFDAGALGGGQAGGQGQAQAQAMLAGFGGEERFEQVLARFGVDAVAVVAHLQAVSPWASPSSHSSAAVAWPWRRGRCRSG